MYKKSLLALAVATASGAALAGSLGNGNTTAITPNYTAEGLDAADEVITGTTAIILTTNLTSLQLYICFHSWNWPAGAHKTFAASAAPPEGLNYF